MKGFPPLSHPLHLLDDLLASLAPLNNSDTTAPPIRNKVQDKKNDKSLSPNNKNAAINNAADIDVRMATAEINQDIILRAACDLFGSNNNNMTLLENALALIDEQKQYQTSIGDDDDDDAPMKIPVIRRIRARRSGRTAILVRKKQRKDSCSSVGNKKSSKFADISRANKTNGNDGGEKNRKNYGCHYQYYLCHLGRDRIDRRAMMMMMMMMLPPTSSRGCRANIYHRVGAHCTCRSFFQNIKGGGGGGRSSTSSSSTSAKSSEALVPISSSSCSNNIVVCKHLLAAILAPHLLPWSENGGMEDEVVDDREFAKLIMRASIG
eukprot:CAMPEP_0201662850 /NCGR_PEP_ID=MMETSP0494-20130426/4832_1 /ASSEMBLY_ACC=CAM_ASM_000839 /TAXON_ID=420259 /ORGANISM="Thalassiosira gravida, Strain GMp14c1" /LENGTH=321 /DNA_ID=CAMNT_0048141317 /DNA_START=158 /DNA_END=1123 /DNA_ORIENTATION=+